MIESVEKFAVPFPDADAAGMTSQPTSAFDLGRFKLSQDYGEGLRVTPSLRVRYGRPRDGEWFRCHPDHSLVAAVLKHYRQGDYLVANSIAERLALDDKLSGLISPRKIVLTLSTTGEMGIWGLKVAHSDNSWNRSAMIAAELANQYWARVEADIDGGCYRIHRAEGHAPDPAWPADLDFAAAVEVAFAGRVIDAADHPIIRQFRGSQI